VAAKTESFTPVPVLDAVVIHNSNSGRCQAKFPTCEILNSRHVRMHRVIF